MEEPMDRFIAKLRASAAVVLFALAIALLATPELYARLAWHRLAGWPPGARRKDVARWQTRWGVRMLSLVSAVTGFTVDLRRPAGWPPAGMPCIVVANHRSSLDILVLMALMAALGCEDLRWIVKKQLFAAPAVGRSCRESGCAYVTRDRDKRDLLLVRRCAGFAHVDGACVVIFPEGTRFVRPLRGSGYERVLPPKVGGLLTIRRRLPAYPVLSVTLRWSGAGKTMFDGESIVGARVTASCALHANVDDAALAAWLEREWRRKDRLLAAS
jgi:1-acyl-sn-glycerol-3-phosphate acyltransferase